MGFSRYSIYGEWPFKPWFGLSGQFPILPSQPFSLAHFH
jgi:hypothetical protein